MAGRRELQWSRRNASACEPGSLTRGEKWPRHVQTMIDARMLRKCLHAELQPRGFVRRGSTWYLHCDEVIVVLNLQKCDWDRTYFLNLGFWLRGISEKEEFPREERCHVNTRAESLWSDERFSIIELEDQDECHDQECLAAIRLFLRDKVIPFLVEGSTIAGIRSMLRAYRCDLILPVTREFLGLPNPQ